MTEYTDVDDLLNGEDETHDVTLPNGKTVQVRGLSRAEWFAAGRMGKNGDDPDAFEAAMIAVGMVNPQMTRKQVEQWRSRPGSGRVIPVVSDKIRALSGFGDGAAKSDVDSAGDNGTGV